jgi:hypothetical protein
MIDALIDLEAAKVNQETARIAWSELQRWFAAGLTIRVDAQLDLVDVAAHFAADHKSQVEQWLNQGLVGKVGDEQARDWLDRHSEVWAVVVKPWILVQEHRTA